MFYRAYLKAKHSKEEIAAKLGFGSPSALFQSLRQDGVPVCPVCGEYSREGSDHCEGPKKRTRRATQTGEAVELPPAVAAADLFRPVVEELAEAVDSLDARREIYRAGRFEQADVYQTPVDISRSAFSEERWQRICEELGQDPEQEALFLRGTKTLNAGGATQSPRETALIAAYVIMGKPIEPLLEVLHPEPPDPHATKLFGGTKPKVPQLKLLAEQVAKLVRGGTLKEGPTTEELSRKEQLWAWHAYSRRQAGVPDKKIREELRKAGFGPDEASRLVKLSLSPPS
jgi:hypothetical protein